MTQINRDAMKVQALLEKISNLTTNYENQIADLRVELTVVGEELRQLKEANEESPEEEEAAVETDAAE